MHRLIALAGLSALLISCTPAQQAKVQAVETTAINDAISVANGIKSAVDAACGALSPVLNIVGGSTNKTIQNIASYGGSICTAAGTTAPGAPINPTTPTWLADIGNMLKSLAGIKPATVAVATPPAAPATAPATVVSVPATGAPAAPPVVVTVPAAALTAPAATP